MLPILKHGVVEVEAMEQAAVEVLAKLRVVQQLRVSLAQVLADRGQEARCTAGRVADDIGRPRCGEFHHQPDDVARCAELPVLSGGGDLSEHVLVDVALGVTFLHWHLVKQVHHLGQQCRGRDGEACVLHVLRVGGIGTPELPDQVSAQIGKDVLPHHREHFARRRSA